MSLNDSKRKFKVCVCDNDGMTIEQITFNTLLNPGPNPYEYINALFELVGSDRILDMVIGESVYFKSNRDHDTSKGIICRIE